MQVSPRAASIAKARALAPGVALVVAGVAAFIGLVDTVRERDDLWELDDPLLEALVGGRTPWLTSVLTFITDAFGPLVLPILVAIGALVWWRLSRSWRDPLLMVAAMLASTALSMGLKLIIGRPRPEDDAMSIPGYETTFSFPSGHTTGAATLVLVAGYLIWRRHHDRFQLWMWIAVSTLIILVVGGSRLYLGYHFLTDVMAGFCLAVTVLGAVVAFARWHDLGINPVDAQGSIRR